MRKITEDFIIELNKVIALNHISTNQHYNMFKNDKLLSNISIDDLYNNEYENYRDHITLSSFLLGYIHFEKYLKNVITNIFRLKNKSTRNINKLKFFHIIQIIRKEYENRIPKELFDELRVYNKLRNSIMHNNSIASEKIGNLFTKGQTIKLTSSEINEIGLIARKLSELLNT